MRCCTVALPANFSLERYRRLGEKPASGRNRPEMRRPWTTRLHPFNSPFASTQEIYQEIFFVASFSLVSSSHKTLRLKKIAGFGAGAVVESVRYGLRSPANENTLFGHKMMPLMPHASVGKSKLTATLASHRAIKRVVPLSLLQMGGIINHCVYCDPHVPFCCQAGALCSPGARWLR